MSRFAGWLGILGIGAACLAPAATGSTLALVEGSAAQVASTLDANGLRALVEFGPGAVIVEASRDGLSAQGASVTTAAAVASMAAPGSLAQRVFRKVVQPLAPGEAIGPACATGSEDSAVESYLQSLEAHPQRTELEARLAALLEDRRSGALEDGNVLDRYIQLRGKVGVMVFFLESDGSSAANDEDWRPEDVEDMLAGVVRSALGWTRVAPPDMNLSFQILHHAPDSPVSAISTEPSHDVRESEWIHQAMANAGFDARLGPAGYAYEIDQYSRWAKSEVFHSDVAFPVFAITDRVHRTSWGEPGWPHVNPIFTYMVLNSTYGNDIVFAHEAGHIFYADDEYAANSLYCLCFAQPVGHLRVMSSGGTAGRTNANCENCNASPLECIMLGNAWLGGEIQGPDACWHSRAQVGWYKTGMLHVQVQAPASLPANEVDILLDGHPIGSKAARRYLKPRAYTVDVHADGYQASPPMPAVLEVGNAQEIRLQVTLTPFSTRTVSVR